MTSRRDAALFVLKENNPNALTIDGADAAFVGSIERCAQPLLACYDYEKLVHVFRRQGMTNADAREWIEYNIAGAWMGPHTPAILYRL